ncbi:MAG: fumarate hydratase [Oscillospiraceae bacterium]
MQYEEVVQKVSETLVAAGSTFSEDKVRAYRRAIERENHPQSKWVMEQILENAKTAAANRSPLCDDTGIPHIYLEVGKNREVTGETLCAIYEGIAKGLRTLPGRPMAIRGNVCQRLDQSGGLDEDPGALLPAPIQIRTVPEDVVRIYVMMEGGGPAIRGKDYRVFHKHSVDTVVEEIVSWAKEAVAQLGCSPCTLAIGIGRSHYEAAAMMMEAQVHGNYDVQSELEQRITEEVNKANIGAMGLKGDTSVIATFLEVGPQRASGVRIVCLRPCCCFEPRVAMAEL